MISRDILLVMLGYRYTGGTRTVDVHVRRLRENCRRWSRRSPRSSSSATSSSTTTGREPRLPDQAVCRVARRCRRGACPATAIIAWDLRSDPSCCDVSARTLLIGFALAFRSHEPGVAVVCILSRRVQAITAVAQRYSAGDLTHPSRDYAATSSVASRGRSTNRCRISDAASRSSRAIGRTWRPSSGAWWRACWCWIGRDAYSWSTAPHRKCSRSPRLQ